MKHRIYSFPLRAEEKQIHTQFTEEVPLRAQPDRRQGPSWGWGVGMAAAEVTTVTQLLIVGGRPVPMQGAGQTCSAWAGWAGHAG